MTKSPEQKCTCPCIDCIEGNHCGGYYYDPFDETNEEPIGVCEYFPQDDGSDLTDWYEFGYEDDE